MEIEEPSFKTKDGSQISEIDFTDLEIYEADNNKNDSFNIDIKMICTETSEGCHKEVMEDLEQGSKSRRQTGEIFVVIDLDADNKK